LLPFDKARAVIKAVLEQVDIDGEIYGYNTGIANSRRIGQSNSFLYFSRDDLANKSGSAQVESLLRKHFS
jgi:hypothetical protein